MILEPYKLELAARSLCEQMGLDPDECVAHGADAGPNGYIPDVLLYSPRWTRFVKDIERHAAIHFALFRYVP